VNAAGTLVPTVGQISPNSTNTFSAAGHSNAAASPTHGKSLFIDASKLSDDPDMPELEDITYSDDEADVGIKRMKEAFWSGTKQDLLHKDIHRRSSSKAKKDGIFISQDKYVAEILRKFRLTDTKLASTPIDTEKPLLKDSDGEDVDVHTYRSMIGSLMYLTSSRPDIMFA
nr:hypothetical protein [Tanacetum cinerariifolium]